MTLDLNLECVRKNNLTLPFAISYDSRTFKREMEPYYKAQCDFSTSNFRIHF